MFLPRGETVLPLSRLGNVALLASASPDRCLYLLTIVSVCLYPCLGPNFPFHRGFSHFGFESSMLSYDFILGNTFATTIFPNKATFWSAGEAGFNWQHCSRQPLQWGFCKTVWTQELLLKQQALLKSAKGSNCLRQLWLSPCQSQHQPTLAASSLLNTQTRQINQSWRTTKITMETRPYLISLVLSASKYNLLGALSHSPEGIPPVPL